MSLAVPITASAAGAPLVTASALPTNCSGAMRTAGSTLATCAANSVTSTGTPLGMALALNGGGTADTLPTGTLLQTGGGGQSAVLQTRTWIALPPGQSSTLFCTVSMAGSGILQAGWFSDIDGVGLAWRWQDGAMYAGYCPLFLSTADWNGDPAARTLDWSSPQALAITIQWRQGAPSAFFYVCLPGSDRYVLAHMFSGLNEPFAYMQLSAPLRFQVNGAGEATGTMLVGSVGVSSPVPTVAPVPGLGLGCTCLGWSSPAMTLFTAGIPLQLFALSSVAATPVALASLSVTPGGYLPDRTILAVYRISQPGWFTTPSLLYPAGHVQGLVNNPADASQNVLGNDLSDGQLLWTGPGRCLATGAPLPPSLAGYVWGTDAYGTGDALLVVASLSTTELLPATCTVSVGWSQCM